MNQPLIVHSVRKLFNHERNSHSLRLLIDI